MTPLDYHFGERPKKLGYWIKHHIISVGFITLVSIGLISFLWGKSSIVIMDTNPAPKSYKVGVKILGQYSFDSMYTYKDPISYQIICADGVKLLVIGEGTQVTHLGVCQ